MSDHVTPTRSARGFMQLPALPNKYGGEVRVYESSAASSAHVWLASVDHAGVKIMLHLTAETAWKLADQLRYLVQHHYQGDASPAEGTAES